MKRQRNRKRHLLKDRFKDWSHQQQSKATDLEVSSETVPQVLGQIRTSKTISRSQHSYLVSSLLANDSDVQPYRSLINRILEATQSGSLQLTD